MQIRRLSSGQNQQRRCYGQPNRHSKFSTTSMPRGTTVSYAPPSRVELCVCVIVPLFRPVDETVVVSRQDVKSLQNAGTYHPLVLETQRQGSGIKTTSSPSSPKCVMVLLNIEKKRKIQPLETQVQSSLFIL